MAPSIDLLTATAVDLQALMTTGALSSVDLVRLVLSQIRTHEPYLNAIIALVPEQTLLSRAQYLDAEREAGRVKGPMHGIPMLLKDCIDTGPELGVGTTVGSLALVGARPRRNARVVDNLLAAGAIILGKANMSEWHWFKTPLGCSGWSSVGGQTQSAYVRGGLRDDDTWAGGHSVSTHVLMQSRD